MTDAARRDLVLTGPMGAGKTTVGRLVAGFLGWDFVDLDARIEARTGRAIPDLFRIGEAVFRAAEAEAVQAWLGRPADAPPEVLALGGGTLQNDVLADGLATRARIVHVDAPAPVLVHRLKTEDVRVRPLVATSANILQTLSELREARAPGYARADLSLSSAGRPPAAVAIALLRALYDADRGPWRRPAEPIGPGVSAGRGALPFASPARAAVVLRDRGLPPCQWETLPPLLEARAGGRLVVLEREGGEGAKTADSLVAAWRELLAAGVDRDVPLWVIGGGTLSDVGGMVAHTFKRGLPLSILPTTLLAQVDAALGGKNGINVDRTKNIAGTVRLPEAVHLDSLFLLSLPDVELRGGMSEAVKSGLIGDPELVGIVENGLAMFGARPLPLLEEIATRAAAVKLGIVGRDLEEQGERRVLNLGHTLGHALESATGARRDPLPHGDAVAIGMVFAARLARRLGVLSAGDLPDRLERLLAALGLPTRVPRLAPEETERLHAALSSDKKRFRGENVWVLPVEPGRVAMRVVPREDVAAVLDFRG